MIRKQINAFLGMLQFYRFECLRWWATHVTHDTEKAEEAARLARTIRRFYALPQDLQDEIATRYMPAIGEALEENER